ncbi:ATPase domain-containing protein [Vulcanisaeta distributa]|uniref:DNA repair and recombination protein RadA n=1 Tax=Vulcanisaeta distributa (strain DSM 14429 / JCM 11212 / NBRC 100878 / IC-017) TaxID=572478 RepID=E1QSP8_VULDI|nr:ATPase domain-containing protein [Vulcanisaeta distributa]ADN49565.1 Rad51 domain protein [Vulcanisaeta distributa DSM 14429]
MTRKKTESINEPSELSRLTELGFSRQTIERLMSVGVRSLRHILLFNAEELQELLGSPDTELPRRLINTARELLAEAPTATTARERIEALSKAPILKTGVDGLDSAVGGLRFGVSHEFAGEFGAGKTIMALQAAVASIGQFGFRVVYIDTEKTVDQYLGSNLIKNMCSRFGVDYEKVINDYLLIYNPATVDDLEDFIKLRLADLVLSNNARVIIVDSITALYRAQFRGRERLAERQQRLHYVLDWLRRLSIRAGVLVVYTNQVMTSPTGFIEVKLPVGGNVLAHTVNARWLMTRASKAKNEGVMKALDVPGLPPGFEIRYSIMDDGLH